MPGKSALHDKVHKRFTEVLGKQHSALDRDDHWSLRLAHPNFPAINVLVNGSSEAVAVWVFDPHILNDGVMRIAITDEAGIDDVLQKILDRVARANNRYAAR